MKTFIVKEEHLKLLKRAYVEYNDYCEFGAPEIDPKRPYGNSDVYTDIAEILGIEGKEDKYEEMEFSHEQEEYMLTLHKETVTVLQIALQTGTFETGKYEADDYHINWRKVK